MDGYLIEASSLPSLTSVIQRVKRYRDREFSYPGLGLPVILEHEPPGHVTRAIQYDSFQTVMLRCWYSLSSITYSGRHLKPFHVHAAIRHPSHTSVLTITVRHLNQSQFTTPPSSLQSPKQQTNDISNFIVRSIRKRCQGY